MFQNSKKLSFRESRSIAFNPFSLLNRFRYRNTAGGRHSILGQEVRRHLFVFADIVKLDDRAVQAVMREVLTADLAMALKGASDEVRDKIMRNLSERAAANLAEEIDLLGPARVQQVEEARDAVIRAIRMLEESGALVVGRGADDLVH